MNHGEYEGEACNRDSCTGTMEIQQESCYCGATSTPPCSACENSICVCDTCSWDAEEDFTVEVEEDSTVEVSPQVFKNLTL